MKVLKAIRIEEAELETLKFFADKEGRTVSNLINKIITDYINNKEI